MRVVNEKILRRTVVEEEKDCLSNAAELLNHVDDAIAVLNADGQLMGDRSIRCVVCGTGVYGRWFPQTHRVLLVPKAMDEDEALATTVTKLLQTEHAMNVRIFRCSNCGHVSSVSLPGSGATKKR